MSDGVRTPTGGIEVFMETTQALGYLVVCFSNLLHNIQMATIDLMAPRSLKERNMFVAALGDRTAKPIIDSFCTVFATRFRGHMTSDDVKMLSHLSNELQAIASKRNRMMHDAWFTTINSTSGTAADMTLHRIVGKLKGAQIDAREVNPSEITDLSIDCVRLNACVVKISWVSIDHPETPHISTKLKVVDGKVEARNDG